MLLSRKDFDVSTDVQSNSLKSRSLHNNNKLDDAEKFLDQAKSLYQTKKDELKPEVGLDFAQTLIASGDKSGADDVLNELVEKYPTHESLIAKVDGMSDTPRSKAGREKVTNMTKSGIDYYENKQYTEAITTFKDAIGIFPSHIGLNLNLIQAVIADAKINGEKTGFETLCRNSLSRVSFIDENDPQYTRYKHLSSEVDELFKLDLDGLDLDL